MPIRLTVVVWKEEASKAERESESTCGIGVEPTSISFNGNTVTVHTQNFTSADLSAAHKQSSTFRHTYTRANKHFCKYRAIFAYKYMYVCVCVAFIYFSFIHFYFSAHYPSVGSVKSPFRRQKCQQQQVNSKHEQSTDRLECHSCPSALAMEVEMQRSLGFGM